MRVCKSNALTSSEAKVELRFTWHSAREEQIAVRRERLLDNLKIRVKSPTKLPLLDFHNRTCSVSLFQHVNRIGSNKELDSSGWGLDTRTRKLYYGRKAQKDGLQSRARSPEGATFSQRPSSPERSKGKEDQIADNIHGSATDATSQTLLLHSACRKGHDSHYAINTCTPMHYIEHVAMRRR